MRKLFIVLTIAIAVGCQSQTDKTNESTSTTTGNDDVKPADESMADIAGCYMEVLQRDTFVARLQLQGDLVTGRLSFDNYEKDGSTGTVTGKLEADVLKLVYHFASEGMNSVMEVYFKYKNGTLTRGVGEIGVIGDSTGFLNPASVVYEGSVLKKIPCDNLPDKYK